MFCSVAAPVLNGAALKQRLVVFTCIIFMCLCIIMIIMCIHMYTCIFVWICMCISYIMYFPINCIFCILWIDIIIISAECFQSFSLSPSETDVGPMLV